MRTPEDYRKDPLFDGNHPLHLQYGPAIGRLNNAFNKDFADKEGLLGEVKELLQQYTFAGMKQEFGLDSPYSLAKEFYTDIICANAGAAARVLVTTDRLQAAKDLLFGLYDDAGRAGYRRDRHFVLNRLDSRTFMPMRRFIDPAYLERIGLNQRERILLAIGDCQTMLLTEKLHDTLRHPNYQFIAYQHNLGSCIESGLVNNFRIRGYFWFCNAAADYGIFPQWPGEERRKRHLEGLHKMAEFLSAQDPEICLFVTHVWFGTENSIHFNKTRREDVMESVTTYSDEVAAILGGVKNARLLDFRTICPFSTDRSVFRDDPDSPNLLHFRYDFYDRVQDWLAEQLRPLAG